jgi:hypothetical protein
MSTSNYRFEIAHVTLVDSRNRYCGSIDVPITNQFSNITLAKSVLLTIFKPEDKSVFTNHREFSLLEEGKFENEYDKIAVCQQYFNELLKKIFPEYPISDRIYKVGHIWVTTQSRLCYIDKLTPVDYNTYPIQEGRQNLEKAAVIVEGMYQYITSGKFTDKCLKLIEEYQALQMLKG